MERHRSLGVAGIVTLMAAHRARGRRPAPGPEHFLKQGYKETVTCLDEVHAPVAVPPDRRVAHSASPGSRGGVPHNDCRLHPR